MRRQRLDTTRIDPRIHRIQHLMSSAEDPTELITTELITPEPGGPGPGPRSSPWYRRGRAGAIGGGALGAAAVAGVLIVTGVGTGFGGAPEAAAAAPAVGFSPSADTGASAAQQTGQAFLADWERGDIRAAADLTDDPAAASAALAAYRRDLDVSGLTLQPNNAGVAGWLTFSVAAQVGSPMSTWSYSSGLAAYQGAGGGAARWFVKWSPAILFSTLKSGQHLALGTLAPSASAVQDSSGRAITDANSPSLANLVSELERNGGDAGGGRPGTTVEIENAAGAELATVATVARPLDAGAVRTTIDLSAQAAAQSAADRAPNSSVVILQPSTGDILAIANNPPTGPDTAMTGALAPGSTFKVVSSTTLMDQGLLTSLDQPVPCPQVLDADGITLHNSEQEQAPGNDFEQDFAQSCNNAFSGFYRQVSTSEIAATAHTYFGFDEPWDIGLGQPTTYAQVPHDASDSAAEEMVGQDRITASPLAMASVAATVAAGSFKQPILLPGTAQAAATPLPAPDLKDLRTLMHAVVTQGTLAGVLTEPDSYGKTGTAEVGASDNSWTIGYRGDYAVCALAVGGGFGAAVAGPQVQSVLRALGGSAAG